MGKTRNNNSTFMPMPVLFWRNVVKADGCWSWKGGKNQKGYGAFEIQVGNGKRNTIQAHRASWMCHFGEIPVGLQVMHKCDNRECTNPEHLQIGTNKDNVDDKVSKKRHSYGEKVPESLRKVTAKNIQEMFDLKEEGWTITKIGRQFNLDASYTSKILSGKKWANYKDFLENE